MTNNRKYGLLIAMSLLAPGTARAQRHIATKPNIVIILADDMGFADAGCFGSEIHTPNIDRLAAKGLKLTQFYNAGRCCPSRTALLTGLYPHQAGVGDMVKNWGDPAYQGYLNDHCATIAELLKAGAGYNTIVSGKWHVGLVPSALAYNRGFDQSFTMLNNASSYFNSDPLFNDGSKITFMLNDRQVFRNDTSEYLTQAITRFAINSLDRIKNEQKPFFLYVAYNAPHWPIQALPQDIARYKGKYLNGWDELRWQRYQKLRSLGVISKAWQLSPRYEKVPDWEKLSAEEKDKWDTRMAIYAAMIDRMDTGIGQILAKIKQLHKDKNTLVLFMSDNGGSADDVKNWNNVIQKSGTPGSVNSIDSYETPWANVSNTPFKGFKKNTHEGGIASPFTAYFPGVIKPGSTNRQVAHMIDILPTCLDLAGVSYPNEFKGRLLAPAQGVSLKAAFTGKAFKDHDALFWEHEGSRAIRKGRWKLVAENNAAWELYDMRVDRSETNNLAAEYPEKAKALETEYLAWAARVGVRNWNELSRTAKKSE
ncbi:sulfatase [Mucilaginibacter sp. PPCGB 2223]|uniref:arylsulfatase n=1 Tax=Mucilaginibacter sp. PPCGB 2223 TaxID=1886027 RepID=UPI000826535C|nr:arylsulfatase [Mucilaginibacter sp. PPCGB 2223]OCX52038.1 sulfatase [Mucilaginibacter sp. PPCGB 2223]